MNWTKGITFFVIAAVTVPAYGQSPPRAPSSSPLPRSRMEHYIPEPSAFASPRSSISDEFAITPRRRRIRDFSRIYIERPEPREVKVHDIITIVVNEKAEITLDSRYNRQRQANLKAELKEFIRLGESGNLTNAADNEPSIDATLNGRLQSTGQVTDSEGIRYRIAAMVVDIRPNGNLVLEAKKSFQQNDDAWEYSLTGILRFEDILQNNTALSENIANLNIVRRQRGKVYNSTKRPWGIKLYDRFFPF